MILKAGFVADFTSIVVDQTLAARSAQWAKVRYQNGFTLTFDPMSWQPQRTWEQEGAMSCGITFKDEENRPIVGLGVHIGWPGTNLPAKTNGDGWVDVPLNGGNYPGGQAGPMWIHLDDDSLRYDGIGWRDATNHGHLNLDVRRGKAGNGGGIIPPEPPVVPPTPPEGIDMAAVKAYIDAAVRLEVKHFLAPIADAWRDLY